MLRVAYHEALDNARSDVVRVGAQGLDALRSAVKALERQDIALAGRVITGDDTYQDRLRALTGSAMELIWRQQPLAGELREVATILDITADLSRIGFQSVEIAKGAIRLSEEPPVDLPSGLATLAREAEELLRDAIAAYRDRSLDQAAAVLARESESERAYLQVIGELQALMTADAKRIQAGTALLFTAQAMQRTAQRAIDIAFQSQQLQTTS